jgi:hypothetical protein
VSARALFIIVGAAWGLLLAVAGGFVAHVTTTGPSDLGFALAIGLAMLVGGAIGGWRYGRIGGAGMGARLPRARRSGYRLLGLWAVVAAALLVALIVDTEWRATERQAVEAAAQDAAFQRLLADRHRIERIDFFGWNADSGTAGVIVRGVRDGTYQFAWEITEPTYGRTLDSGEETLTLEPGRRTIIIGLEMGRLAAAYREKVLTGAGGVLIQETLHLSAHLTPVPDPAEQEILPPAELQDLIDGRSPLRDVGTGTVAVSFQIPPVPEQTTD